jgi:carbon storage regulator
MLVLSRQRDETIIIGDDIEITVVDIRGEKVRLGINAPPHVPVHRKEVYEAIKREGQAAAQATGQPAPHVESLANRKRHPAGPGPQPGQTPPTPTEQGNTSGGPATPPQPAPPAQSTH